MGKNKLTWILFCLGYLLLSGILPLVQLIIKGDVELGFEIGWLGLTEMKLQNPSEFFLVSSVILLLQFLFATKLWKETIVRETMVRNAFFVSVAFIYLITFLSDFSDFLFNLCNLYTNIGIGYFLFTKSKFSKIIFYVFYFTTQILQFSLTSGRGYLLIPVFILLWFMSKKINFKLLFGSGLLIFCMLFYMTRVKFETLDDELLMNFILGRFNQLDSLYIFYHNPEWLPNSSGFWGQRYLESIDYLDYFESVNLDLILYNQVFAADLGGFAVHPFAELYWYSHSSIMSLLLYVLIMWIIFELVKYLSNKFQFVKLYVPVVAILVFVKPESMVVVGQVCIKNLFFLVIVELILVEFEGYFCKKSS